MKRATAIVAFKDLQEGVQRAIGDSFVVDDERAEMLAGYKLVTLSEVPAPKKTVRKKATSKKEG